MDHELLELIGPLSDEPAAGYDDTGVGLEVLDPVAGDIAIHMATETKHYRLKLLGDLFGEGVNARTLDYEDEHYMPLLMGIEESILRFYEQEPRLNDARVSRALSDLAMHLDRPPGPAPLRQRLWFDMRLLLSLNDYSRRDVRRALRKIRKSVRRHTQMDGPRGYLDFIRAQFRPRG